MTIRSTEQIQKDIDSAESELRTSVASMESMRWTAHTLLQHVEQATNQSYRLAALRDEQRRAKAESERRADITGGVALAAAGILFFAITLAAAILYPTRDGSAPLLAISIIPFGLFLLGFGLAVEANAKKPK